MIPRINQRRTAGNTLLIVLMLMGILTLGMGVYLNLTSTENKRAMRSSCWNAALPLAEAGIEEAMSHLARNTNDYSLDGWVKSGTNHLYLKSRTNGADYYSVEIAGDPNETVTISSTGAVHFVDEDYITRTVQVTARAKSFPSPAGMVAKGFTLGGTMRMDSYDSSNPLYCNSNNVATGWYDFSRRTDQAFMGNPGGPINFGGNASLRGYAAAAPGFSVTAGGSARVGDNAWVSSSSGVQRTPQDHGTNGFTMALPDVAVTFTGSPPRTNSVGGTGYDYYLAGGDYVTPDLTSSLFGKTMYVAAASKLYVSGSLDLSLIVFANGARLDLYVGAPSLNFNSPLIIAGAPPTSFVLWGLPTCTRININSFAGIIYAPQAAIKAVGNSQFYGALTVRDFTAMGNFRFHHDLAAGKAIPPEPLTMLTWNEVYPRE
jgi:Tfp pilus assembly protein PilX